MGEEATGEHNTGGNPANLQRLFETPQEIVRIETVELDPVLLGFTSIVTELSRSGDLFTLYQFAAGTGNRLLLVQSQDETSIRELFQKETEAMLQLAMLYDNPPAKSR